MFDVNSQCKRCGALTRVLVPIEMDRLGEHACVLTRRSNQTRGAPPGVLFLSSADQKALWHRSVRKTFVEDDENRPASFCASTSFKTIIAWIGSLVPPDSISAIRDFRIPPNSLPPQNMSGSSFGDLTSAVETDGMELQAEHTAALSQRRVPQDGRDGEQQHRTNVLPCFIAMGAGSPGSGSLNEECAKRISNRLRPLLASIFEPIDTPPNASHPMAISVLACKN